MQYVDEFSTQILMQCRKLVLEFQFPTLLCECKKLRASRNHRSTPLIIFHLGEIISVRKRTVFFTFFIFRDAQIDPNNLPIIRNRYCFKNRQNEFRLPPVINFHCLSLVQPTVINEVRRHETQERYLDACLLRNETHEDS